MTEKPPKYIDTELGKEKLCIHCGEYWPLDDEFWFHQMRKTKHKGLSKQFEAACKCCYYERYKPEKLTNRSFARQIRGAVERVEGSL